MRQKIERVRENAGREAHVVRRRGHDDAGADERAQSLFATEHVGAQEQRGRHERLAQADAVEELARGARFADAVVHGGAEHDGRRLVPGDPQAAVEVHELEGERHRIEHEREAAPLADPPEGEREMHVDRGASDVTRMGDDVGANVSGLSGREVVERRPEARETEREAEQAEEHELPLAPAERESQEEVQAEGGVSDRPRSDDPGEDFTAHRRAGSNRRSGRALIAPRVPPLARPGLWDLLGGRSP